MFFSSFFFRIITYSYYYFVGIHCKGLWNALIYLQRTMFHEYDKMILFVTLQCLQFCKTQSKIWRKKIFFFLSLSALLFIFLYGFILSFNFLFVLLHWQRNILFHNFCVMYFLCHVHISNFCISKKKKIIIKSYKNIKLNNIIIKKILFNLSAILNLVEWAAYEVCFIGIHDKNIQKNRTSSC